MRRKKRRSSEEMSDDLGQNCFFFFLVRLPGIGVAGNACLSSVCPCLFVCIRGCDLPSISPRPGTKPTSLGMLWSRRPGLAQARSEQASKQANTTQAHRDRVAFHRRVGCFRLCDALSHSLSLSITKLDEKLGLACLIHSTRQKKEND